MSAPAWERRLGGLPATVLPGGLTVHRAASAGARLRGLAGLSELPADRGLLLPGTRAVHTVGMRVALDLVWLDGAGEVVRVDRGVAPRRHRACRRARAVLEVAAGAGTPFADSAAGATLRALTVEDSALTRAT